MSDSYHYEDGAKHYDHKKVLHIDKLQGADLQQLMRAFFKDDAEEEEVLEELSDDVDQEGVEEPEEKEGLGENVVTDLVEKLKPIFFNNENDVRLFLKEISGMQPNNITDLVNRWVKDKRISSYGNSKKGELWKILNEVGLYPRSRQNWCRRVY